MDRSSPLLPAATQVTTHDPPDRWANKQSRRSRVSRCGRAVVSPPCRCISPQGEGPVRVTAPRSAGSQHREIRQGEIEGR